MEHTICLLEIKWLVSHLSIHLSGLGWRKTTSVILNTPSWLISSVIHSNTLRSLLGLSLFPAPFKVTFPSYYRKRRESSFPWKMRQVLVWERHNPFKRMIKLWRAILKDLSERNAIWGPGERQASSFISKLLQSRKAFQ